MSTPTAAPRVGQNEELVPSSSRRSYGTVDGSGEVDEHSKTVLSRRDSVPRDSDVDAIAADGGHTEIGVSRVEAFNKVLYQSGKSGKILLWLLGISIGLTMFA